MNIRNHQWLAALAGLAMLLALPGESHAGLCDWFKCKSCQKPAAVACNPCAQAQTVSYVPQTSYRCQSVTVPVTSYQPVVSSDPCSGCPVTSYKPVTSFVQQTRMVPFTSYRLVYTNRPCVTCAAPVAATAYVPSTTYVPTAQTVAPATYMAPAACPTCPGGTASYGTATAAPSLLQAPSYRVPSYGSPAAVPPAPAAYTPPYGAPNYGAPTYGAPNYGAPNYGAPSGTQSTFAPQASARPLYSNPSSAPAAATSNYPVQQYSNPGYPTTSGYAAAPGVSSSTSQGSNPAVNPNSAAPGSSQQPMRPIPDPNLTPGSKVNSSSHLRLVDPDNRTTSYQPGAYTPVAWNAPDLAPPNDDAGYGPTTTIMPLADDDGWRASNR